MEIVSATSAKWTKTKRRPRTIRAATLARHKRFVAEYVIDHNGARAARAAGYAKRTANVMASQLLARADVQQLVVEAEAEILKTTKMTAEGILDPGDGPPARCTATHGGFSLFNRRGRPRAVSGGDALLGALAQKLPSGP